MKPADAIAYLRERARMQRTTKTSYNRLRWTNRDLEAVETLLAEATARATQGPHEGPGGAQRPLGSAGEPLTRRRRSGVDPFA